MKKLRIALQMDALAGINPRGDSTLALGIEAIKRGHEVFYYTPDTLAYRDGTIRARAHSVKLFDNVEKYHELGDPFALDLNTLDVVLLRQDPPFDMTYLTTTYILEMLAPRVLVVNDPASVRNHPEKLFPTQFHQFMPPTLITADKAEITAFYEEYKDIVLKPLYGFGGRDISHIKAGDNAAALIDEMLGPRNLPIVAQKFLPEVASEDRRIILIDGEVGGVFGRTPQAGDFRANMAVGGTPQQVAELTKKQRNICEALKQPLKDAGLIFVGLDCIGDFLTEINITSPTGLRAYRNLTGIKLEEKIWDAIEGKR